MNNQVAITQPGQIVVNDQSNTQALYGRINNPLEAIEAMGKMFAASGMFGCTKDEQGQVLAWICFTEGKSPREIMANYHIIHGSLSMKSTAVLAAFMSKGGKCVWHSALNDAEKAVATFSINGNELEQATYTIADATREKLLVNDQWTKRPADMLRARLITKAVRMIAPGIIMGVTDETDVAQPETQRVDLLPQQPEPTRAQPLPASDERELTLTERLEVDGISLQAAKGVCISRGLLSEGDSLNDLTPAANKRIIKNYSEFVRRCREWAPEPAATTTETVEAAA